VSRLGELSAAAEAGYAAGRARRRATAQELARFRSRLLSGAYRRGVRRGRRAQARFEQMGLDLTETYRAPCPPGRSGKTIETHRLVPELLEPDRARWGPGVTPEQRAAEAVRAATELGMTEGLEARLGPKWHSIIARAITEALVEARATCSYIPDRDAISDLMIGRVAEPVAPASYPASIDCFVCEGSGAVGSVTCQACQGKGVIVDHGPPPDPNLGLVAFKPCGCAADWVGGGAPAEFRLERLKLWESQGYRSEPMDFSAAGPLITAGGACKHDQRATPRETTTAMDLSDLPPGSQ